MRRIADKLMRRRYKATAWANHNIGADTNFISPVYNQAFVYINVITAYKLCSTDAKPTFDQNIFSKRTAGKLQKNLLIGQGIKLPPLNISLMLSIILSHPGRQPVISHQETNSHHFFVKIAPWGDRLCLAVREKGPHRIGFVHVRAGPQSEII